MKLTMHVHK